MLKKKNNVTKLKFKKKITSKELYGLMPVWKVVLKVGISGILMSFVLGMFTFADQLMLVNFMPLTLRFCFNNLFFTPGHEVFLPLVNHLQAQSIHNPNLQYLYNSINAQKNTNGNTLQNLVSAIGNINGLGVYGSDSVVRSGVSLSAPLSGIIFVLPSLYSIGVAIKYPQALGKGNRDEAIYIWQNAFYGTIVVTLIGCVLMFILIATVTQTQAVSTILTTSNINQSQQEIINSLNNNNLTATNFLLSNNNQVFERIYFVYSNNHFTYYINVSNNEYINISKTNLLMLDENKIALLHLNINKYNYFDINLINTHNSVLNTWNNYFATARMYSITWAQGFLYIATAGLVFSSISSLLAVIIRSDGAVNMVTFITVFTIAINIVLDFVFIKIAQIGMDGAACATVIGWIMQAVWLSLYLKYSKKLVSFVCFCHLEKQYLYLSWKLLWQICLYGGTVFVGNIGFVITDILLTNQVTYVSTVLLSSSGSEYYLSIMGAVLPLINLFIFTVIGFLQFVSPIFSFNYASKNYKRVQEAFWLASLFTLIFGMIVYILFGIIHPIMQGVLDWFNINENTSDNGLDSAIKLISIWLLQVPIYALSIGGMLTYLATNRVGLTTFINLLRSCIVFVPVIYIFSTIAQNDATVLNAHLSIEQKSNPYYNNAMWFFMWNVPTSYLIASFIIFVMTIVYIYKYMMHGEKRPLHACEPFKTIIAIHLKKYLNHEDKIRNIQN